MMTKKELGTRVDRHEHIGLGLIGADAFKYFMNDKLFIHIPKSHRNPEIQGRKRYGHYQSGAAERIGALSLPEIVVIFFDMQRSIS